MTATRPLPALIRMAGAAFAFAFILAGALPGAEARERAPLTEEQRARLMQQVEEIQTRLDLSEDQRARLEPVLRRNFEQRMDILKRYGVGKDTNKRLGFRKARALKSDLEALRETNEIEVAKILDDRQMTEYLKIQEEMRDAFRQRMRERRS